MRRFSFFAPLVLLALVGVAATLSACGASGGLVQPSSTAVPFTTGTVFVSDPTKNQIVLFAPSPGPNAIPANPLAGTLTQLNGPQSMAFDGGHNLYISNFNSSTNAASILIYSVGTYQNNTPPTVTISGSSTQMGVISGIAVDSSLNIYVSNCIGATGPNCSGGTSSILIFGANAKNNAAPATVLSGSATGLAGPRGLAFDKSGNLWVANSGNGTVTVYPSASLPAAGNIAPSQTISANGFLQAPADIVLDANTPSFAYVSDSGAKAIFVYSSLANGTTVTPVRVIQGAATALNNPGGLALSAVDGTLYVANATNLLLFAPVSGGAPGTAGTNVAPEATLTQTFGAVSDVELSI